MQTYESFGAKRYLSEKYGKKVTLTLLNKHNYVDTDSVKMTNDSDCNETALAERRAVAHDVFAGGITHCDAQCFDQTMEDVISFDSSFCVYDIIDNSAGDCADASEVYGA